MINLEEGTACFHIGLNGASHTLLHQRDCQRKGDEPTPCRDAESCWQTSQWPNIKLNATVQTAISTRGGRYQILQVSTFQTGGGGRQQQAEHLKPKGHALLPMISPSVSQDAGQQVKCASRYRSHTCNGEGESPLQS